MSNQTIKDYNGKAFTTRGVFVRATPIKACAVVAVTKAEFGMLLEARRAVAFDPDDPVHQLAAKNIIKPKPLDEVAANKDEPPPAPEPPAKGKKE